MVGMLDPRMFDPQMFQGGGPLASIMAAGQAPLGLLNQPGGFEDATLPTNATPTTGPMPQESGGFLSGLGRGIANNSNMLMALGAGIAGGRDLGEGISKGLSGAMGGAKIDRERGAGNLTYQALIKRGVDPATAQAAITDPNVLKALLPSVFRAQNTSDITEYEYAKKQGFKGSLAEWMAHKRAGAGEYGLQPIWGTGPDGKPTIVQLGKSGTAIQSALPQGVTVGKDAIKLDAGTHHVLLDPVTRQQIGVVPKNVAETAAQGAQGKLVGEARFQLPTNIADGERAVKEIDEFVGNKGLSEIFGPIDQFRPSWTMSDKGRDALARFKQLQGRTFLQAYSVLRGGGQITEVEGAKAEAAMARLDRAQSEEDAKTAIKDFRDAVTDGMKKLREKAGVAQPQTGVPVQAPAQAAQPSAPGDDPLGLRR